MFIRIRSMLLVLLLGMIPAVARSAALGTGTVELQLNGAFDHTSLSFDGTHVANITQIGLSPGVGYCVTRMLELEFALTVTHTSVEFEGESSESASGFGATGGLAINVPTQGNVVPFVAAGIGALTYSGDGFENAKTSFIAPYIRGGIRVLVNDTGSVNFGLGYQHQTNYGGTEKLDNNAITASLGVSVLLNRR